MGRPKRKRSYGTGQVRLRKKTGKYEISWYDASGTRRYRAGFASRELATEVLKKLIDLVPSDTKTDDRTLDLLFLQWASGREATHRSTKDDRSRWGKWLSEPIGKLQPHELTSDHILAIAKRCRAGDLSGSTTRLVLRLLSTFSTDLVDQNLMKINLVKGASKEVKALAKPTFDSRTVPYIKTMDQGQGRRCSAGTTDRPSLLPSLGSMAGLRTSECRALNASSVDMVARRIAVVESVRRIKKPGQKKFELISGPPKSGKSRFVPIFNDLYDRLKKGYGGPGIVAGLPVQEGWRLRFDSRDGKEAETSAGTPWPSPGGAGLVPGHAPHVLFYRGV